MMGDFVPVKPQLEKCKNATSKIPPSPPPRKYGSLKYKLKNREKVKS